ncbi:hypothetical protein GQ54DRAFT_113005 [Martensiomyces pterosporus]|nr:hypothetical protein GQ54DRAFT_113005 [Martensiomyces pterosporus]
MDNRAATEPCSRPLHAHATLAPKGRIRHGAGSPAQPSTHSLSINCGAVGRAKGFKLRPLHKKKKTFLLSARFHSASSAPPFHARIHFKWRSDARAAIGVTGNCVESAQQPGLLAPKGRGCKGSKENAAWAVPAQLVWKSAAEPPGKKGTPPATCPLVLLHPYAGPRTMRPLCLPLHKCVLPLLPAFLACLLRQSGGPQHRRPSCPNNSGACPLALPACRSCKCTLRACTAYPPQEFTALACISLLLVPVLAASGWV